MDFDKAVLFAKEKMERHHAGRDGDLSFHLWGSTPSPNCSQGQFETYLQALAYRLEENLKLSDEQTEWLVKYLRDEIVQPKKNTGRPRRNYRLKLAIAECVTELIDKGLTATRNDATAVKESACDAVAQAMGQLRLYPQEFSEVKKIYTEVKNDATEWAQEDAEHGYRAANSVGVKDPH